MSRDPENQDALTDEESDWLQRFRHYPWPDVSKSSADAGLDAGQVLAKLLRIHDAQRERITELERSLPDPREYLCTCGHLRGEPHRLGCGALP